MPFRPFLNGIPINTRRIHRVISKCYTRLIRVPSDSPDTKIWLADKPLSQSLDAMIDMRREVLLVVHVVMPRVVGRRIMRVFAADSRYLVSDRV